MSVLQECRFCSFDVIRIEPKIASNTKKNKKSDCLEGTYNLYSMLETGTLEVLLKIVIALGACFWTLCENHSGNVCEIVYIVGDVVRKPRSWLVLVLCLLIFGEACPNISRSELV